jgi:DNA-binding transcriptional LysR family regulator
VDNRQLYYFLAIVEEGNISKAAEKLHIAQPYLSQMLKLLEDELDIKLIKEIRASFWLLKQAVCFATEQSRFLTYQKQQSRS